MQIIGALSATLATVEQRRVDFDKMVTNVIPRRRCLQHFSGVKALRTELINDYCIARAILHQDHAEPDDDLGPLPASSLEEAELAKTS
jgi:hypothetical protein